MKKLTLFLLLVLTMASCTINEDEPDTYWKVVNVSIPASDWRPYVDDDGLIPSWYACAVSMPEISSFVYSSGMIQTYYVEKTSPRYQENLPYVRHFTNGTDSWTSTIDCTYSQGSMTFYITHSDFATNDPPGDMSFRVVIMW